MLCVGYFIYKSMDFAAIKEVTVSSAVTSATLLLIVASATCFGRYLTFENIPNRVAEIVVARSGRVASSWPTR